MLPFGLTRPRNSSSACFVGLPVGLRSTWSTFSRSDSSSASASAKSASASLRSASARPLIAAARSRSRTTFGTFNGSLGFLQSIGAVYCLPMSEMAITLIENFQADTQHFRANRAHLFYPRAPLDFPGGTAKDFSWPDLRVEAIPKAGGTGITMTLKNWQHWKRRCWRCPRSDAPSRPPIPG